ncbi:MAG: hypothetical protein ABEI97_04180 [Candidatus Nanohaloarchaea archaeon]
MNTLDTPEGSGVVVTAGSDNNTIVENTFIGATRDPVRIEGSEGTVVANNTFRPAD